MNPSDQKEQFSAKKALNSNEGQPGVIVCKTCTGERAILQKLKLNKVGHHCYKVGQGRLLLFITMVKKARNYCGNVVIIRSGDGLPPHLQ